MSWFLWPSKQLNYPRHEPAQVLGWGDGSIRRERAVVSLASYQSKTAGLVIDPYSLESVEGQDLPRIDHGQPMTIAQWFTDTLARSVGKAVWVQT